MNAIVDSPAPVDMATDTVVPDWERLQDITDYSEPYHIHFDDDSEGAKLNPEGAEYNFDALIILTKFVKNQMVTKKSRSGDAPDPNLKWFLDKYPATDIKPEQLRKPSNVVRLWLKQMGSHNDMAGSEGDLLTARSWMLSEIAGKDDQESLGSKEFRLVADIDLELAELFDDEQRVAYLREAETYLEYSRQDYLRMGDPGYALLDQAALGSVRLEIERHELLGSGLLTEPVTESDYDKLEETAMDQLNELELGISSTLDIIIADIEKLPSDSMEDFGQRNMKNLALVLEAITYYSLLEEIYTQGALASAKVGLGTMRQEKGLTHKIIRPGQTPEEPKDSGFNFNFDIIFTQINGSRTKPGDGLYSTTYIQNKLDEKDAPGESANSSSTNFFRNKAFKYITPHNLMQIDGDSQSLAFRQQALYFARRMKDFVQVD